MKRALWIKGYKNLYKIFPDGKIISFKQDKINGREVKPRLSGSGYYIVTLTDRRGIQEQPYWHQLLAEHYLINPNKRKFKYVGFIDGNPGNVYVTNLIWVESKTTQFSKLRRKNYEDVGMINSKISKEQLIKIAKLVKLNLNLGKIASLYNIHRVTFFKLRQTNEFKKVLKSI